LKVLLDRPSGHSDAVGLGAKIVRLQDAFHAGWRLALLPVTYLWTASGSYTGTISFQRDSDRNTPETDGDGADVDTDAGGAGHPTGSGLHKARER